MVALVAEEELGVALEASGEGGVGTEICGGIYATIAGGHIEGACACPAIEGFHAEVVIIVLGEGAISIARFKDGHGDDSGGGDPSGGLDEHGFGNSAFEEATLAESRILEIRVARPRMSVVSELWEAMRRAIRRSRSSSSRF